VRRPSAKNGVPDAPDSKGLQDLRGNVVDLAVAVVIGAAFGALGTALVRDLLTPIIGLIFGEHDFSALKFTINGSQFSMATSSTT
jgi:large conductance mechanosensitive channel